MKKNLLLFSCMFSSFVFSQSNKSILFIGNSYTYVNNLPQLIHDIAITTHDTIAFDSNTPGGSTFQMHSTDATTLTKISQRAWDYVVLQEQSQMPSFPPSQVQTDVYPYAKQLNNLILANDSCTKTVFYMTWGRKYGDASNCSFYSPLCTYEGMQERLRQSYLEMADSNEAWVSPVGAAFRNSRIADSTINLYAADNSHPSLEGSYLAACVFYARIYKKNPVGNTFISTLNAGTAAFLQNIAKITVLDSLTLWNDNKFEAHAGFTVAINDLLVNFTNATTGIGTYTYNWNFGDTNYSSAANLTHIYDNAGTYTVSLISSWRCVNDTSSQTITVTNGSPAGITQLNKMDITIFPNPAKESITLSTKYKVLSIKVNNVLGETVFQSSINNPKLINMDGFKTGIYFLQVETEKGVVRRKVVKE